MLHRHLSSFAGDGIHTFSGVASMSDLSGAGPLSVPSDDGTATAASDPQADFQVALQHHQAGRLAEAEVLYRRILDGHVEHADSLQNLGLIVLQLGRTDEAIKLLRRVLDIRPRYAEVHNNLAVALQKCGEIEQAVSHWEKAVALKPDYAEAYGNLARVLNEQGKTGLALACWERAVALKPDHVGAQGDFAAALQRVNRFDEAIAHYERALALKPDHIELHCSFAAALRNAGRTSEAVARYQKALALGPDHVGAHVAIGGVLETEGKTGEATAHYERALALRPELADLRFRLCTAQLPILYLDEAEIEGRRAAYRRRLEQLRADVEAGRAAGDLAAAVGSNQPFFLPYQGQNDRDLQSLYGALVCRIVADKYPAAPLPPPPLLPDEKVRVGIVSGLFRHHTVWKLMIRGWLSQLDRRKFRVFCYHTGADRDAQTDIAASQCDRFVQGPLPGERWREEILADRPHILIYPDIGMDPGSAWIAAHRLAPIQCVSWGHPNTTGYPTIDYFLSSELMEPPDAEQHYTERLVRLPSLSIFYEPLDLATLPIGREQLGLRPSSVAYWCGQSLFKYLPQYDQVFPRIARAVGDCQFIFIQSPHGGEMTARLRRRLDRAFAVFGLDASKHCVFLPRLGLEQFVGAIGQCDVVLDSIGWSGGNSTLEGLAHDTPIVTMAGSLMRGRHTMAILKRMGVTDTIAETVDDYVEIAARLGRDTPWRTAARQQISENKHRVYRDSEAITALEDFFCRVAAGEAEPAEEHQAAESGPLAPDRAEGPVVLDAPAPLDFSPQAGTARPPPQADDLHFTSDRNKPNRKQRRAQSAATEISAIRESKHRELKHLDVLQREGA
jgi:protein O-GlcNAc transferase